MKILKNVKMLLFFLAFAGLLSACSSDDDSSIDQEYPTINLNETNPQVCSVLQRGEVFTAKIVVDDNQELGSVSIDIHHNFDHHNHSTEVEECELDAKKEPIDPFTYIKSIPIPEGNDHYVVEQEISIPEDIDAGDYHFMIRVTDAAGWQTMKGISIKIK